MIELRERIVDELRELACPIAAWQLAMRLDLGAGLVLAVLRELETAGAVICVVVGDPDHEAAIARWSLR